MIFENIHLALGILNVFVIFLLFGLYLLLEIFILFLVLLDILVFFFQESGFVLLLTIELRYIEETGSDLFEFVFKLRITFESFSLVTDLLLELEVLRLDLL